MTAIDETMPVLVQRRTQRSIGGCIEIILEFEKVKPELHVRERQRRGKTIARASYRGALSAPGGAITLMAGVDTLYRTGASAHV